MEPTFQLNDILNIFKKRMKLIVIIPIIFTMIGGFISFFLITPIYEVRADLLINNPLPTSKETYQLIIESDYIMNTVSEELDNTYSNNELKKKLRIETDSNTQIISLFVKDSNLKQTVEIANLFAKTIQAEIQTLMSLENIQVLTTASADKQIQPMIPKTIIYTALSFLIGFMIICIYTLISAYFNTTIGTKEEVEKYLGLRLLGNINTSKVETKSNKHEQDINNLSFILRSNVLPKNEHTMEAYRTLRTNLLFQAKVNCLKSILITSTVENEGKTMTSKNLAAAMAVDNKRTVLIDADLRKQRSGIAFGRIGLTDYLSGYSTLEAILIDTSTPNLKLIAAGSPSPMRAELFASPHMDELLAKLKEQFDQIIIDSPPLFLADPSILATKVDGCLLVLQADKTKVTQIHQGIEQLRNVQATILGTVLNKTKPRQRAINYSDNRSRWRQNEKMVGSKSASN